MSSGTHNAREAATRDAAVPCVACGYDVRGLPAAGRCPECGIGIAVSLAARVVPAAALDPQWRRQVAEAAVLSLAAFVLQFAIALVPAGQAAFVRGMPAFSRGVFIPLVVLAVAGWALQWYSTIKLCRWPQFERHAFASTAAVWATRGLSTLYAIVPLLALEPLYRRRGFAVGLIDGPAVVIGPLCAVAYYHQVARAFRRLGAPGPAAQAALLSLLMPLSLLAFRTSAGTSWGPLGRYATLPSYQHVHPTSFVLFASALLNRQVGVSATGFLLPSVVGICGSWLHVRLLVLARRGLRTPAGPSADSDAVSGPARLAPAPSRPGGPLATETGGPLIPSASREAL